MASDLVLPQSDSASTASLDTEGLPPVDVANSRDDSADKQRQSNPDICAWFKKFKGTVVRKGKTVVNSLRAYAWVKQVKGTFPVKISNLLAFVYEKRDIDGVERSIPVGKAFAYRMWSIVPSADLTDPEVVKAWDAEDSPLSFRIVPLASVAGVKKASAKPTKSKTNIEAVRVDVPRIAYKNPIIVDFEQEVDGTVLPIKVRANYYMRLMFENRSLPKVPFNGTDGEVRETTQKIFASSFLRKSKDVTDEFLAIFEQVEGKDIDERVHNTLAQFLVNPALAGTSLARIMQMQARSVIGAVADTASRELKREYDLVDRLSLYATTVRDCMYGVERGGSEHASEYTEYMCRIMSIEDPITMNAQRLAGRARVNDGTKVVLSA